MKIAFDPQKCNFRGMFRCDAPTSVLKQKAFVQVSEEGAEAAGATIDVHAAAKLPVGTIPIFMVNRPFFYAIRDDRAGEVLFLGMVTDPTRTANL